jgi:8-oxo-dGTP pyrophosphatase MutT (NUDIX family)
MQAVSRAVSSRTLVRPAREPKLQSGALAYKIGPSGKIRVLLVRTRRSKRWSIPKGGAEPNLTLAANAAKEAFEEAGVIGEIEADSIGMFRTTKRAWYGEALLEIWVYRMRVTEQADHWPEEGDREVKWVSCREAARILHEPLLSELCRSLRRKALS